MARLEASTVDHRATIVDVVQPPMGRCMIGPGGCRPSAGMPCSEVLIFAWAGTPSCALTFVSVDGATYTANVIVQPTDGPGYMCTELGQVYTAHGFHFEPGGIDVDFTKQM